MRIFTSLSIQQIANTCVLYGRARPSSSGPFLLACRWLPGSSRGSRGLFFSTARLEGLRIRDYLDDWLLLAPSEVLSRAQSHSLVSLALEFGFLPNWEKSSLVPAQSFSFLGMDFNTTSMLVSPSQPRLTSFTQLRESLLEADTMTAWRIDSFAGCLESLAPLIPLGRVRKREFQRQFHLHWDQSLQGWDQTVGLIPWFRPSITD